MSLNVAHKLVVDRECPRTGILHHPLKVIMTATEGSTLAQNIDQNSCATCISYQLLNQYFIRG